MFLLPSFEFNGHSFCKFNGGENRIPVDYPISQYTKIVEMMEGQSFLRAVSLRATRRDIDFANRILSKVRRGNFTSNSPSLIWSLTSGYTKRHGQSTHHWPLLEIPRTLSSHLSWANAHAWFVADVCTQSHCLPLSCLFQLKNVPLKSVKIGKRSKVYACLGCSLGQ